MSDPHLSTPAGVGKVFSNSQTRWAVHMSISAMNNRMEFTRSMTAAEARELAAALMMHADRIEPKGDGS